MRIDVFSAWGECVDVGVNIEKSDEDIARFTQPERFTFLTFTSDEARELAARLITAADQADHDKRVYEDFVRSTLDELGASD